MPSDVPPRPGQPGYAEFISHQGANDQEAAATASKPGAAPAVATVPAGAAGVPPPAGNVSAQPLPPDARRIDTQAAAQGGLY